MSRHDLPSRKGNGDQDADDDEDDDLRNVPAFTAEDERREIGSLTLADFVKVQSDLAGLTSRLESLQPPSSAGNAAMRTAAAADNTTLHAVNTLEAELHRLPQANTEAYYQAVEKCPDQVDQKRKMAFLGANSSDVRATATHIAEYWKARVELFGNVKAFLPMTLGGVMRDEKMNLASRCVWQLLPYPDTAGRPVLFFCPGRRNFAEYSKMQENAALWYFLETIIEEESLRKNGFVILADMRNFDWQKSSKKMIHFFDRMMSFMPLELRGSHLCYPNAIVHHLIFPLIKRIIPRHHRLRLQTHHGTISQVLTDLSGFCLPVDRVPVDLGGVLAVNAPEWVLKREVLETLRQHSASTVARGLTQYQRDHPQQLPPMSNTTTALLSAAIAKVQGPVCLGHSQQPTLPQPLIVRQPQPQPQPQPYPNIPPNVNDVSSINDHTGTERARTARSSDGHFATLSDHQLYQEIVKKRHTDTIGRKADPRMNRALALVLQNPDMSSSDAVVAGGFDFPDSKSSPRTTLDSEGISLKQRQDQLARRLREAKKWIQYARKTGDLSGSPDE